MKAGYLWGVYPRSAADPLVASGSADSRKEAQREVEAVLGAQPGNASWGKVTGPGGYQSIGRRDGGGGFTWDGPGAGPSRKDSRRQRRGRRPRLRSRRARIVRFALIGGTAVIVLAGAAVAWNAIKGAGTVTVACQIGSVSSSGDVNYTVDITNGTSQDISWVFLTLSLFDSGGTQIYNESPDNGGAMVASGASATVDDVASTGQPGIAPASCEATGSALTGLAVGSSNDQGVSSACAVDSVSPSGVVSYHGTVTDGSGQDASWSPMEVFFFGPGGKQEDVVGSVPKTWAVTLAAGGSHTFHGGQASTGQPGVNVTSCKLDGLVTAEGATADILGS